MKYRRRIYYTAEQRSLMWDRYKQGESLHTIARLFDRYHSSVPRIIAESGGIRPPDRKRYFLAALLNEINRLNGLDQAAIERWGIGVDEVLEYVSQYPAERVEHVTGISVADLQTVAKDILAADGASIYLSVGVNQGGQGLLSAWLADVIIFVTGNLGRKGGMFKPTGFSDMYPPSSLYSKKVETSIGELRYSSPGPAPLATAILPKLMASGDVKALMVIGGNPLQSAAGELEWREAIENLELSQQN